MKAGFIVSNIFICTSYFASGLIWNEYLNSRLRSNVSKTRMKIGRNIYNYYLFPKFRWFMPEKLPLFSSRIRTSLWRNTPFLNAVPVTCCNWNWLILLKSHFRQDVGIQRTAGLLLDCPRFRLPCRFCCVQWWFFNFGFGSIVEAISITRFVRWLDFDLIIDECSGVHSRFHGLLCSWDEAHHD